MKQETLCILFLFVTISAMAEPIVSAAEPITPRTSALVPGLRITRLPFDLPNIDSVEYGPDGRLYAAGYDGRIHVLSDTNGDALEDKAEVFWDKPGDLLTPVGILPTKDGVYVAARGKISLIKDTDGDGIGDTSETVVSGWTKEKHNSDTRNDAAGLAIDDEGNLYFSLGCMSYNKAWLLDGKGKSHYDINSERGTLLKVSPDRKYRDIVATGLRFVVGIDFNKHGDLFVTDQEGDTWFPGGNPRDELLHILPGRHYGFPFRHPEYLPDVVDEPFVVGFSPQHQSTCGFRFNETRQNRKRFGPDHWDGNAIVTGFSRGKLWRVPLAKTRAGYVGKQVQFAAFESLLTDVAISPRGNLLVTSHSGKPDWGAGPAAKGNLYQLTFDSSKPQPVIAWSASPIEFKVAFDRPIDKASLGKPSIEIGDFVWEGDQNEWIWPGYEVVKAAKAALRRPLKISSSRLSTDHRTLTITTAPQPWRTRYALRVPAEETTNELSLELSGVQAKWTAKGESKPTWSGWLPHVDSNVIRELTAGSSEHKQLLSLLRKPGQLSMRSTLVLPGRKVDFRFESSGEFQVHCGDRSAKSTSVDTNHVAELSIAAMETRDEPEPRGGREQVLPTDEVEVLVAIQTGSSDGDFRFDVSYQADFDPHDRPLRLESLIVPWAPRLQPPAPKNEQGRSGEQLAGDIELGRKLFFGKEANCSACHMHGGIGGKVAADLTVSVHRDPAAVMQDIIDPSASINPDYVSYTVLANDGRVLTGLFQSADEQRITLIDNQAKSHGMARKEIESIKASPASLMPTGFEKLGKEKLQNLVAFLCSEDPQAKKLGKATGAIRRDFWLEVPGRGVSALTKDKRFPDTPTGTERLRWFEGPVNGEDQYGSRIRGYIHPPQSGDYTFWLAADDYAELWLSESDDPAKKKRILKLGRWTPSRKWDRYPEQKSKPIRLDAGKRYYIEALHHEAAVDDCLAVGWQLPNGTTDRPVSGKYLSTQSDD